MGASNLSKKELEAYGTDLIQWYWDALENKPPMSFNAFVNQIFFDAELGKNYRSEDLPDLGYQLATYLLDHPFPNKERVMENIQRLARNNPQGMVPTTWALGQAVVDAAGETSLLDYFKLTKEAITNTGKEYKQIAVIAASTYAGYKIAALVVAGLGALALLMKTRRKA